MNSAVGPSAILHIYSGGQPTSPDAPATGVLLATLTCNPISFGTVTGGALALNTIPTVNAIASGTAGYARILTSGSIPVIDLDCGIVGTSIILNSVTITVSGSVSITAGTITEA